MKLILIILALFLIGAITAYCSKKDYPFADGGKAILAPELHRLSER